MPPITFRPHHFLCSLCFQGKGYSPDFIANFQQIVDRLREQNGDSTPITVTTHTDDICSPCPHKQGNTCNTQTIIDTLDEAHAKALNILPNEQLSWGEAKARIAANISLNTFKHICSACSWQHTGICESALKHFLQKN